MLPRRTTIPGAVLAALALSGCGDQGADGPTLAEPGPSTSSAPGLPDDLTCPTARLDHEQADDGALRSDGTARMRVTARRGSDGWYPDTLESCSGDGPGTAAAPYLDPAAPPSDITCAGNVVQGDFDFAVPWPDGPASALEAAQDWVADDGQVVVLGADGHTAYVLRADGSAHTELTLAGADGHGWAVEGYRSCEGEGPRHM
jgi:hypothetical protein